MRVICHVSSCCVAIVVCFLSTVATSAAQTGPVAAYAFSETSGTTASDSSGNARSGTVRSGTWTASGYFGRGLSFNGTSTWVTIADHALLDVTTAMTLEAWVRPTTLSGWRTVIFKEAPGQLAYTLYAHDNAPRPAVYVNGGQASEATVGGTAALPLNTWTHLATTYDGTTLRLYVNGIEVGSRPAQTIRVTANALRIGGNSIWGEYFAGIIDEVRIYRRVLTAGEIQVDMATPVGTTPTPDTTPPTVSVTSPAAGAVLTGTVTLSATASDNIGVAGVRFLVDGASVGVEDTTAPYSIQFDARTLTNTGHQISATARDAAGTTATASPITVTANNPPTLVIITPAPGASVTGPLVGVTYTETGDLTGVDHVHFTLDGGPEVMDRPMDGSYAFDNVPPGPHVLNGWLVRADHSKISGTDAVPRSFTVTAPDTTPPTVALTAPAQGASVSGTVSVNVSATDDVGLTGVQFLLDGLPLGSEDTSSPFSVSWNTGTTAVGNHQLSAVARDAAANTATSANVLVTVVNPNESGHVRTLGRAFRARHGGCERRVDAHGLRAPHIR